jgi:selenide, water dikinase
VLSDIPAQTDPRILVDFRTADDAGVYAWESGPALVQTVDFFTPIVDDPFTYGQIAAANSLSDVYAMGGRPVTALAIAGFPDGVLDADTIGQIFRGGFDKLREAGVALLGGHTVRDPEVKFGYAVTGAVDPNRILTNAGAKAGNVLLLTKPLGTGILGTAIKFGRAPEELIGEAVRSMTALNAAAAGVLARFGSAVHACTDITGFGLVGHASEMAQASGVSIAIDTAALPLLPGILDLVERNKPGGLASNRQFFAGRVAGDSGVPPAREHLCYDPQTSGGLLVSVDERSVAAIQAALGEAGVSASVIGTVGAQREHLIALRP